MRYVPLRDLYNDFNARFWEGRLPPPERVSAFGGDVNSRLNVRRVGVSAGAMTRGLLASDGVYCAGTFRPPTKLLPAQIRVLSPLNEAFERRVLLHEMCHAAVWFTGGRDAHGPQFIAELERLAAFGEAWAAESAAHYLTVAERVQ